MDFEIVRNVITLKHKLKRNELYRFNKSSKTQSLAVYNKPLWVYGYSSRTADNKDIIMGDYDNVNFDVVTEDIKYIQNKFKLSTAFIFASKKIKKDNEIIGNFHFIILDKLNSVDIINVLKETHIDKNYLNSPIRNKYRSWVLRLSEKGNKRKIPKYFYFIESAYNFYEKSMAHRKLLNVFYPTENKFKIKYKNEDNLTKYKLEFYETANY